MRFIVWDKNHGKVFGIFGLCDPLIGLKVRDDYIGWSKKQREERLYNMMSAYILGVVPPFAKLVAVDMMALWREFLKGETDQLTYVNKSFEEYVEFWKREFLKGGLKRWSGKAF